MDIYISFPLSGVKQKRRYKSWLRTSQVDSCIMPVYQLPRALDPAFVKAVYAIQEEKHMPYVNTVERLGIEKGRQEGRQEGREEAEQRALEAKRNAARKLIALTEMDDQLIADIEELPVKEVERLRQETQH